MRTKHLIAESILILITLILGSGMAISGEWGLGFLLWLQVLGISQVVHSFIIGALYWKHEMIRNWIIFYWIGVAFDFILMYINDTSIHDHAIAWFTLPVFPLILALYLWFITYYFRRRSEPGSNAF